MTFGQTGSGIAMETLIESTVRVTIRHSDREPIASEAATAVLSREEATGAERPLKPTRPGDRIMVRNPYKYAGRITRNVRKFRWNDRQYCGGAVAKMAKTRQ
jgi:hypothetical protein